jgi:hypothetical protein
MPLRFAIIALLVAAPSLRAAAQPSGRVDLRAGIDWQDDAVELARARATATGGALSDVGARGAWFPHDGPFGIAARLQLARFGLARERGLFEPEHLAVTGVDTGAGLALRARARRWLELEGRLGYGFRQVPVVLVGAGPAGDTRLSGGSTRGHGPDVGARLRLALGARVGLELEGEAAPLLLGARYAGTTVHPRVFAARAGASVDVLQMRRTRWAALVSYEWSRTTAAGDGVELSQRVQRIAVGLRATWAAVAAPPAPAPPPPTIAPPTLAVIAGVVRAEGQPVAAHVSIPELGLDVAADARGGFRLEVPPGRYTLIIEAPGLLPQRQPIVAAASERHIYDVDLQREAR